MLSGKDIITIQIEFEDQFKIVFRRTDMSGKFTFLKNQELKDVNAIFDSVEELIEYRIKRTEKQVMDLQLKLKTICEEHSEFLKRCQSQSPNENHTI